MYPENDLGVESWVEMIDFKKNYVQFWATCTSLEYSYFLSILLCILYKYS